MATSYFRGHKGWYDNIEKVWKYFDTNLPIDPRRPCVRCGKEPTPEGHDACLGRLDGAWSACCGHGVIEPYLKITL